MDKNVTLNDFMDQLRQWNLLTRYYDYFFDEDTNLTVTHLEEPGDIEEWLKMGRRDFIAYMGLLETMNFLEGESSQLAGTDDDFIGRPHFWYGVNQYWIKNYPKAYRYLEVAVWG